MSEGELFFDSVLFIFGLNIYIDEVDYLSMSCWYYCIIDSIDDQCVSSITHYVEDEMIRPSVLSRLCFHDNHNISSGMIIHTARSSLMSLSLFFLPSAIFIISISDNTCPSSFFFSSSSSFLDKRSSHFRIKTIQMNLSIYFFDCCSFTESIIKMKKFVEEFIYSR